MENTSTQEQITDISTLIDASTPSAEKQEAPKTIEHKPPLCTATTFATGSYICISDIPLFDADDTGIKYDFNDGLRVLMPETGGPWRVFFYDDTTHVILYNAKAEANTYICSSKAYYTEYKFEVYDEAEYAAWEKEEENWKNKPSSQKPDKVKPIFEHRFNLDNKTVMIQCAMNTLGDVLGWFPYCEEFRKKHRDCSVVVSLKPQFIEIFKDKYQNLKLITQDQIKEYKPYATYYLGLFFGGETNHQPCDFRFVGNHRTAGYILGLDQKLLIGDVRPSITLPESPVKPRERYVCIATHSSCQAKYWNHPRGWYEVIKFLNKEGFKVYCIDKEPIYGTKSTWNYIPNGAIDDTGTKPLQDRINRLAGAKFFIGLSSGLSWLAWACNIPVVMISGFTHPLNEFYTPYRVINYNVCNSCWNDSNVLFDHKNFLWCPRHQNDDSQFECSRLITPDHVIDVLKRVIADNKAKWQ